MKCLMGTAAGSADIIGSRMTATCTETVIYGKIKIIFEKSADYWYKPHIGTVGRVLCFFQLTFRHLFTVFLQTGQ